MNDEAATGQKFGEALPEGVGLVSMVANYVDGTAEFTRSDGMVANVPLGFPARPGGFNQIAYFYGLPKALAQVGRSEYIQLELPMLHAPAPRGDRPVVYLDQKDWSLLAKATTERDRVPESQRTACDRLMALAGEGQIILPLSAAHLQETAQWSDGRARDALAETLLRFSRGWQLHDPLGIRRAELSGALAARFQSATPEPFDAVTLTPGAVLSTRITPPRFDDDADPDLSLAFGALQDAETHYRLMTEHIRRDPGPSERWSATRATQTEWLRDEHERTKEEKRKSAEVFFLDDLRTEAAQASSLAKITAEQLSEWLRGQWRRDIDLCPALGMFRGALQAKTLDGGSKWEANDLTDLMYLSTAAGYVDHVVGDRKTIAVLEKAARGLGRNVGLHRSIADLVRALEG